MYLVAFQCQNEQFSAPVACRYTELCSLQQVRSSRRVLHIDVSVDDSNGLGENLVIIVLANVFLDFLFESLFCSARHLRFLKYIPSGSMERLMIMLIFGLN